MTTIEPQPAATNLFELLPDACISLILKDFLGSPGQSLTLRGVCRDWRYNRLRGVAIFQCRRNVWDLSSSHIPVTSLEVKGKLYHPQNQQSGDTVKTERTLQSASAKAKDHPHRAKGHLPPPRVLEDDENDTHSSTLSWSQEKLEKLDTLPAYRFAAHLEETDSACAPEAGSMTRSWNTIDWTESHIWMKRKPFSTQSGLLGQPEQPTRLARVAAKRMLIQVDLSSLQHLQRCSFSGCSVLKRLRIPGSLKALDVSGCTLLQDLHAEGCHLDALNLNGCRSLSHIRLLTKTDESPPSSITSFSHAESRLSPFSMQTEPRFYISVTNAKEIDLSSTTQLPILLVAQALAITTRLELISLRYVAQDSWLDALAQSTSAQQSLHRIDLSFSSAITDKSVLALVKSATHLERVNLRGCQGISVACYNQVPLLLRGSLKDCKSETTEDTLSSSSLKRKGDNIFHLLEGITGNRQTKKKN